MTAPRSAAEIVRTYVAAVPLDAELDAPPIIRIMNRTAFLTLRQNGVQKRIQTNRAGLAYLRDQIDAALDCPVSNINGIEAGNVRD
jgi:hypothetical protein